MDQFLRAAIDEAKQGLAEGGLPIEDMVVAAVAATAVEDFRFPMLESAVDRSTTAQGETA